MTDRYLIVCSTYISVMMPSISILIGFLISIANWLSWPHFVQLQPSNLLFFPPTSTQIVEHIVLLKVKEDTNPSRTDALLNGLKDLGSIDGVLYLSAGPVYASSSSFNFTLMLHSRFGTKEDLESYMEQPEHLYLVEELQKPILEDAIVIDFVADLDSNEPVGPPPGSATRVSLFKLKDRLRKREEKKVLQVIGGIKDHLGSLIHPTITFGKNFTPKDAKGFAIASLEIFPGINELEAFASSEVVEDELESVKDLLESILVVDYLASY